MNYADGEKEKLFYSQLRAEMTKKTTQENLIQSCFAPSINVLSKICFCTTVNKNQKHTL